MSRKIRKIVLIGLMLFVAISFASILALPFSLKKEKQNVNAVNVETTKQDDDVSTMSLRWSKNATIKPMLSTAPTLGIGKDGLNCTWNGSYNGTLYGGTEITFDSFKAEGSNAYSFKFNPTKSGENEQTATITPKVGYKLSTIEMYSISDENKVGKCLITFNYDGGDFDTEFDNVTIEDGAGTVKIEPETGDEKYIITPEDLDPDYTGHLYFDAVCEKINYKLNLKYSDDYNDSYKDYDDEFVLNQNETLTDVGYNIVDNSDISQEEKDLNDVEIFKAWVLKLPIKKAGNDFAETGEFSAANGTEYAFKYDDKVVTISSKGKHTYDNSKPKVEVKFTYNSKIENALDEYLYFTIESVTGYGDLEEFIVTDGKENPLIRAQYSYLYPTIVNNSMSIWCNEQAYKQRNKSNDYDLGGIKTTGTVFGWKKSNEIVVGTENAVMSDGQNPYSLNIRIAANKDHNYGFVNNEGKAFEKKNSVSTYGMNQLSNGTDGLNGIAVYSYGQHLTGWKIIISDGSGENPKTLYGKYDKTSKILTLDESEYNDDYPYVSIDDLTDDTVKLNMGNIAALIDDRMPGGFTKSYSAFKITLTTQWENVDVQLNSDNITKGSQTIKYNADYAVDINSTSIPSGQSIMCFTVGESETTDITSASIVANSGKWNYIEIDKYNYIKTDKIENSNPEKITQFYSLNVSPYYVDNIYKVVLTDTGTEFADEGRVDYSLSTGNTAKLLTYSTVSGYEVNGYSSVYQKNYVFKNFVEPEDGQFKDDDGNAVTFIEDYIDYNNGFDSANLGLRGNVKKYKILIAERGLSILRALGGSGTTENPYYIYLANNQQTGKLPVFKKSYYENTFWFNSYNSSNPSGQYAYPSKLVLTDPNADAKGYFLDEKLKDKLFHIDDSVQYPRLQSDFINSDKTVKSNSLLWKYADGNTSEDGKNPCELQAHWYRKYYNVSVETLLKDSEADAQVGYVLINVYDTATNTESATYIIYYNEDTSKGEIGYQIYKFEYKLDLTNFGLEDLNDNNLLKDGAILAKSFKLYAGCNVTVSLIDQSKDSSAANSRNFDWLIGYKANSYNIKTDQQALQNIDIETLEGDSLPCNANVNIQAWFDKIIYNLYVSLDKAEAGNFTVGSDGTTYDATTINGLKVGSDVTIKFSAVPGYKLTSVTMNSVEVVLNSNKFTIDGTWLREHYYSINDTAYTTDDVTTNSGNGIIFNTEKYSFNLGVMIEGLGERFDASTIDDWDGIFTNKTINNGDTINYGDYFLKHDTNYGWYISDEQGQAYAIKSIRPLRWNSPSDKNKDKGYTQYNFKLEDKPNKVITLGSNMLAYMMGDYDEVNKIHRIYICLELAPIYELTMNVVGADGNCKTTINGVTYNGNTSQTIYVLGGTKYQVSTEYNSNVFNPPALTIDNGTLEDGAVNIYGDSELTVTYSYKQLEVAYNYYLGDEKSTKEDLKSDGYLGGSLEATVGKDKLIVAGEEVTFNAKSANAEYDIEVKFNGTLVQPFGNNGDYKYTITNKDYDSGKLNIDVYVKLKNHDTVTMMYVLKDSSELIGGEVYGNITAIAGARSKEQTNSTSVEAVAGNTLKVNISGLNTRAYTAVGIQKNNNSSKLLSTYLPDGAETYILDTNFDPVEDSGTWYVVVEKKKVSVQLDLTGSLLATANEKHATYSISSTNANVSTNGNVLTLGNLFVGRDVSLNVLQVRTTEEFRHFYYLTSTNKKIYLTEDGEKLDMFTITEEIIQVCGGTIRMGVEVYPKYKLTATVNNPANLDEESYKWMYVNEEKEYVLGTPITHKGSDIKLTLTINSKVSGKYNIALDDGTQVITQDNFANDQVFTLSNADKHVNISITPKVYSVNVKEYIFNTYNDLYTGLNVVDGSINSTVDGRVSYGSTYVTAVFTPNTNDKELRTILISGNEGKNLAVFVDKTGVYDIKTWVESSGKIVYTDMTLQEGETVYKVLEDAGYKLSLSYSGGTIARVQITYVIQADINIDWCYVAYKTVSTAIN